MAGTAAAMNHDSYPDSYIRGILNTVKTIAMVGISPKDNRPSYFVFKYLRERGYRMIPVNPGQAGKEILGQKVYARLAEIPEPVDMVDIFRGSEHVLPVVQEALTLTPKPKVIWMQLTVRNDEAARLAEAAGLKVVMNRCPKIEYGRLSSEIGWIGVNSRMLSSKRAQILGKGVQRMGLGRKRTKATIERDRSPDKFLWRRTSVTTAFGRTSRLDAAPARPVKSLNPRGQYGLQTYEDRAPMADAERTPGFATLSIHAGAKPDPTTGARATPIYQTTSFVFDDVDHAASLFGLQAFGNIYTRIGNPTCAVLEERVAALEGGTAGLAVASGHAAQVIVMHALMMPGDEFVASKKLYGGSINQFNHSFKNFGWNVVWADPDDIDIVRESRDAEDQGDLHRVDRQSGRRHHRHRGGRQDRAQGRACR